MEEHATIPYLREVVIFLIAAGVIVPLFHRLRISPVLGYLVIGGIIGPYGLGLWAAEFPILSTLVIYDLEGVQAIAELGIVFLLFTIGLELSLDRLWAMRRLVFGLGSLQIVVTAAIIGLIAWEFGNSVHASIVLGACLALSSTAIVMQLLMQNRRLATPLGRSSFSILLMQDLAVVPILFVVGVLGARSGEDVGLALLLSFGKAILAIVVIYVVGRLALRPVMDLVARSRSPEMFMAAVLLTVIGTSAITGAAGLSMALGAFLAGLLIAETEYRHEVEVDIEPFKGLLLGLFFISIGMGIDWRIVGEEPLWILAAVAGLFVVKSAVTAGLCLAFRIPAHTALEAGLLLGQGGEFGFIVVGLAMSLGILGPDIGQFMLIVTGLTMFATPLVATTARRVAARLESREVSGRQADDLASVSDWEGHVIIAGYGRVGATLADALESEQVPWLAIDLDPDAIARGRAAGRPVFYGDATRFDMLVRARIEAAQAVVMTIDAPRVSEDIVRTVHSSMPEIAVYARARDIDHAARLRSAGASLAVPETVEASLQLAGRVLMGLGFSEEVVARRLEQQRAFEEA